MKLSPGDYSNAGTVFLVATIIFQLPGTLLIKKIHPNRQFAGAMIMWGILTAITVVAKNSAQLLVLRFFIGAAESFVQGGVFCMFTQLMKNSSYYIQHLTIFHRSLILVPVLGICDPWRRSFVYVHHRRCV